MRSIAIPKAALLAAALVLAATAGPAADFSEKAFGDPLFRRCIAWMLDGNRGALLQNLCLDEYDLPPPSLFLCARKLRTGFASATDREACALIFEEEARKVREGYIR